MVPATFMWGMTMAVQGDAASNRRPHNPDANDPLPMDALTQALRGARHEAATDLRPLEGLLVVGAGGKLGSAVLAQALVAGRFSRVMALVAEPVASALRGLEPLALASLPGREPLGVPAAVLVFERERHSNGRDDAFVQPEPSALPALARTLHERGVRRLVVVVPHAPAMLPRALSLGLASLDEAAVAALGFEHLVFLRAAQGAQGQAAGAGWGQRLAATWLSQLSWMVPQRQQPLRAEALGRCVAQLVQLLPSLPGGTRVVSPETLWQWSQHAAGFEAALIEGLAPAPGGRPP
jgi:hypothetical protein